METLDKVGMARKVAAALYPSTVDVRDMVLGKLVRLNSDSQSLNTNDTVGIITHIIPATQKVWVCWQVGRSHQHSPEELTYIPDGWGEFMGKVDQGYDSYEKAQSRAQFGTVGEDGKVAAPVKDARVEMVNKLAAESLKGQ